MKTGSGKLMKVHKKISKYAHVFAKLRYYVPREILIKLYNAFVYSNLLYCIVIWGKSDTKITYLQPLFKLQKKLARIITFSKHDTHAQPLFNKLKMLHMHL